MSAFPEDIAIIGMACIFPGAPNIQTYWQNIISKVDAISEPSENWGAEIFFDPNSTANDRIYCKRGGYLGDLAQFNPFEYGIMPRSIDGGEPDHFLALRVAQEALSDAGYVDRPINRERTAVIIGKGTSVSRGYTSLAQHCIIVDQTLQILKHLHPEYTQEKLQAIRHELKALLPPFNAEVVPALTPNILTGRIANRLDLMGPNYVVDAACASALIAVENGIQSLVSQKCDMAIVGGVNASASPPMFMIFCQINAISRKGMIRPFDKEADGILLGEGIGMVVLKRRKDAERDGDRIYAVIKGIGIASDGRALGLLTPRVEGEELALRRAYESTGISPSTIELIEAHGTGIPLGDLTEIQALSRVFGPREGAYPQCALGSVKSMIGHLIPAAGIAGLIKTTLALYHKILPPTLNCSEPNPKLDLDKTPFYINTETRPWIHGRLEPRRAGVNAFGFGGINTHAILEEYSEQNEHDFHSFLHTWDTEVFIIQGESRQDLIRTGDRLLSFLSSVPNLQLKDLAYTMNCPLLESGHRLAIVANSLKDLEKKISYGLKRLADSQCTKLKDRSGIFFFQEPLVREGTLAFLFPGEGSQYVNMLSDLCLHFPDVRACFDRADRAFLESKREILPSHVLFPPPLQQSGTRPKPEQELWNLDFAVASVFLADYALFTLLNQLEIKPHVLAGHSSGEYTAILASGAMEIQDENEFVRYGLDLLNLSPFVAEQIPTARLMTVGNADPMLIEALIAESNGSLYVAMDNCPHQVILCGHEAAVANALSRLQNRGAVCSLLPYNRPYHTPLYRPVCDQLFHVLQGRKIVPPHTIIYSCATAQPYPHEPTEIRRIAAEQWAKPVCFRETINALYKAGVRIFVEVGPRGNLTGFVDDILRNHQYLAVPSNVPYRSGTTQLNYMVGLLAAHGVSMRLDYLYRHREPHHLSFETGEVRAAKSEERTHSIRLAQELPILRLKHNSKGSAPDVPPSIQINQDANLHSQDSFRSKAMQDYLQTMEQFLATQQEIMASFLARAARTYSDTIFSTSCPQLVSHLPPSLGFQCCRLSEIGGEDRLQTLTHNVLNHQELKTWLHLPGHEKRRKEWLSGRLAAKDAVRLFLKNRYQLKASPADIEISTDAHGRPIAGGELIEKLGIRLTLSITHSAGSAVAVAGEYDGHVGVGIDMEQVGQNHEGLERMALTTNEQALLSVVQASRREEWLLRLWCAKESVAKALGRGMVGGPNNLIVQGLEEENGRVSLALMGELARQLPTYANRLFNAYTKYEDDFVFAISLV